MVNKTWYEDYKYPMSYEEYKDFIMTNGGYPDDEYFIDVNWKNHQFLLNLTEICELAKGLVARNIPFTSHVLYGGIQIMSEDNSWDVIIHYGSYGRENGLLEVAGAKLVRDEDAIVEGYLTAEEILKIFDWEKK